MKFHEYYNYYLSLHQNKWCRRMHVIGQLFTLLYVALVLNYQVWVMLLLTPFVVYPFAWAGHYVFEKNKPAAFSNPVWAKVCDWIMLKDWILGRLER
ncbi:DUF962 domain-containing protein [Hyphomonas sp.]|uniref:DUF962 domain-containing protein n=1 Tax=Hyphomonas sp. TaxID=87 RepID=UPI000C968F83|nr:DUF962 domain-containing protein [Hyphomonas sp.]MAL45791.1 hypothetical protein [Hyphomonas sp.]